MEQIPDAPWIRQAENDGMDECGVECPICGDYCETVYADMYGNVFACDKCLMEQDSRDWYQDELEKGRPE